MERYYIIPVKGNLSAPEVKILFRKEHELAWSFKVQFPNFSRDFYTKEFWVNVLKSKMILDDQGDLTMLPLANGDYYVQEAAYTAEGRKLEGERNYVFCCGLTTFAKMLLLRSEG